MAAAALVIQPSSCGSIGPDLFARERHLCAAAILNDAPLDIPTLGASQATPLHVEDLHGTYLRDPKELAQAS